MALNEAKYRQSEEKIWKLVGRTPTEQRVRPKCTGTEVRVQVVGEGPPVLFVHGGPNSGTTWAPMLQHFDGFRCFVVDRPGTGLSEDYVMTQAREHVLHEFVGDVLDALHLERAHVVASSFGGYLALRAAAADSTRFDRMVQMACPAMAPGMLTPPFMKMMRFRFVRWLVPKLPPSQKSNDDIMMQIGHGASLRAGRFPKEFSDWYLDLQRYTNTMKNELQMIGEALVGDHFDPAMTLTDTQLGSVDVPTLFLWGKDDGFGGVDVARDVVSAMPDATLEMLPDSGHLPWLDDPKRIADRSAAFLSAR